MSDFTARLKVLLGALPTILTAVVTVITALLAEHGADWPWLAQYGPMLLTWIGAALVIVRSVTPVAKSERGLLPTDTA